MIAAGLVVQDGRFLMVKQQKHGRIFWNFPGGHIEPGESPEEACIREVEEGTGYRVRRRRETHRSCAGGVPSREGTYAAPS